MMGSAALRAIGGFILLMKTPSLVNQYVYGNPPSSEALIDSMLPFIALSMAVDGANMYCNHPISRAITYTQNRYILWREQRRLDARENARKPLNDLLNDFEELTEPKKETLVAMNLAVKDRSGEIYPHYYCKYISFEMMSHPVQIKVFGSNGIELETIDRQTIEDYLAQTQNKELRVPGTQRLIVPNEIDGQPPEIIDTPELQTRYQQYLVELRNEIDSLKSIIQIKIQ